MFSFVLNTHLFTTPRCPQPGSHLSVHKVFHLLKEEISQLCHCPAASFQNSQACHQSTACPKQDAVLQQIFQLDALLSFYHSGGEVNNHLSLYYPMLWNIAGIYSIPHAFNCPGSGRIHEEDHMGGSYKAASSSNKQKDFSVQWLSDYKGWQHTARWQVRAMPQSLGHVSSHSHTATGALSKANRGPLKHHSSCCPMLHHSLAIPGQPTSQVTQQWLRNYHLVLAGPNILVRTQTYENLFQLKVASAYWKHYGVDREAEKILPHLSPPAERWSARLRCSLGYHVLVWVSCTAPHHTTALTIRNSTGQKW